MTQTSTQESPNALFARIIASYQAGNANEVEAIYQDLLASYPQNTDVLVFLGLFQMHRNTEEAARLFEKAITLDPSHAVAHYNHGNAMMILGRYGDALESYNKAIVINPRYTDAYKNRAFAFYNLKQDHEALGDYTKVIALTPGDAEAHNHRGIVFTNLKNYSDAVTSYDKAIAINPDYAEAYNNRGIAFHNLKQYDSALANHDKAIALNPGYAQAYNSRGVVLHDLKRYSEALGDYDKAIVLNPGYADAHNNRGLVLRSLNRYDEALASCSKAIVLNPGIADAHLNKSLLLLLLGEYEEGWKLHEWRWKRSSTIEYEIRLFNKPLWVGKEPLAGKTILLHAEQGLGDSIQFCRYATMVKALGANVILEIQPALAGLISASFPSLHVITRGSTLPDFDFHCPLMSLPLAFGTTLNNIPAEVPYLKVDAEKQKSWKARLGERKNPRIGLVWSGAAIHTNDYNRSIALSLLTPLLGHDFDFYSLQKEVRPGDDAVLENSKIISLTDDLKDFSDTAAFISEMDLVISVDTSVAHLAGALGKAVWVLLPFVPDFRWLLDRQDSPWYPTARVFRQQKIEDWEGVIAEVKRELASYFGDSK